MFILLCAVLWLCTYATLCKTAKDCAAYAVELAAVGGALQYVIGPTM